jgi:hypothetical protein
MSDSNTANKERFSAALYGTFEIYERQCSKMMIQIWWAAVKHYDIDLVCKALTDHITDPDTGHFPPKPADVIRHITGTKTDVSMLAWHKVLNAMSYGAGRSVCFDDAAINQTISDIGGWQLLLMVHVYKMDFKAKQFETRYQQYINNPPLNPPTHLIGREEQSNNLSGFPSDPPIMIGDKAAAKLNFTGQPSCNNVIALLKAGKGS